MYHRDAETVKRMAMARALQKKLRSAWPRRGAPAQTRERLVAAAATLFNRAGYHGTDSNRIAREAGYSTGVFYKHFADKREIFLAAYETWVASEWQAVGAELSAGGKPEAIARRLVALSIRFHTRWRGLRASLLELVFTDAEVRHFYRTQRRRQLDTMAALRIRIGGKPHPREHDVVHLFTTERTCDAIAQGELRTLGLNREAVVAVLVQSVLKALT
jgi:AcrR family transcriptional regulator